MKTVPLRGDRQARNRTAIFPTCLAAVGIILLLRFKLNATWLIGIGAMIGEIASLIGRH